MEKIKLGYFSKEPAIVCAVTFKETVQIVRNYTALERSLKNTRAYVN